MVLDQEFAADELKDRPSDGEVPLGTHSGVSKYLVQGSQTGIRISEMRDRKLPQRTATEQLVSASQSSISRMRETHNQVAL